MSDARGRERRKYIRITVELAAKVSFGGREVAYPAVFARDISAEGVGLELRGDRGAFDALRRWKAEVETELHLLDGNAVTVDAEVAWGRIEDVDGERRLRVGMRFVGVGEREREVLSQFAR